MQPDSEQLYQFCKVLLQTKLSWNKMKNKFPDEWLLIVDYEVDENGHILSGVVARHSAEKDEVFALPALDQSSVFKYTGESTFPGGWRAHAKHHHV